MLQVLNLRQPRESLLITNAAPVYFQAFSPDGTDLAVLTRSELKVFDTRTWTVRVSRPAEATALSHLAYSPDGRLLLCTENVRKASVLDARTLEPLLPMPDSAHPLEFTPDGRRLLVSVESRRLQLWDWTAVRAKFRELGIDWRD